MCITMLIHQQTRANDHYRIMVVNLAILRRALLATSLALFSIVVIIDFVPRHMDRTHAVRTADVRKGVNKPWFCPF